MASMVWPRQGNRKLGGRVAVTLSYHTSNCPRKISGEPL